MALKYMFRIVPVPGSVDSFYLEQQGPAIGEWNLVRDEPVAKSVAVQMIKHQFLGALYYDHQLGEFVEDKEAK